MERLYQVTINGVPYNIVSDKSQEYINKIETYVNNKIVGIIDENPKVSTLVAAIITALSAAEDLIMEKEASDRIREQITDYSQQAYVAQSRMEEYKAKYEELLKQNERLRNGF